MSKKIISVLFVGLLLGFVFGFAFMGYAATTTYEQLNETIHNSTLNSCMAGCGGMLSLMHSNDTNANTAALATCWNACGNVNT